MEVKLGLYINMKLCSSVQYNSVIYVIVNNSNRNFIKVSKTV